MKGVQWKDFFREIKKSWNRFLSILLITTLGVAFYAGVRSTEPDMQLTVDQLYDETNFMDIRVVSTLGLTGDDLAAIKELPGVKAAEPGMQTEAFCEIDGREYTLEIFSLGEEINQMQLTEGRMPEEPGECIADDWLAKECGLKVGDTLLFHTGKIVVKGDEAWDEIMDTLHGNAYVVSGLANYSNYLTWNRGTSSIGDGKSDGFIGLLEEAFCQDREAVQAPIYHNIYVTVEGAKEENCYQDRYEELVDETIDCMEQIADARCEIRYQAIQEDARKQLTDARIEIADGEAEVADGEKELEDAKKELEDAKKELEDARGELLDGQKELEDGWQTYKDGLAEIEEKEAELEDAKEQLQKAREEIVRQREELENGKAEYEAGRQQLEQSEKEMTEKAAELAAAKAALPGQRQQLEQARKELEAQSEELSQAEEQFFASFAAMGMTDREAILAYVAGEEELSAQYQNIEAGKQAIQEGKTQLEESEAQLEAGTAQIEAGEQQIASAKEELEAGKKQLKETEEKLTAGEKELDEAGRTWQNSWNEMQAGNQELSDARQQLEDARLELVEAEAELANGRKELNDGEKKLSDASAEYEEKKAEAEEELADARKKLSDAKTELSDAEKELEELEKPEWILLKRSNSVQNFIEYGMDTERIGAIGKVFPALFFLVATLVCLTTMTRMVEEERTQIGTLKALGYFKASVAAKYILYALAACLLGGVLGVLGGSVLFPYVIITAYQILYINTPAPVMPLQIGYCVSAILIAVCCTVFATAVSCYRELAGVPAQLMRPASPKQGKRVFLERISFIWKHLSFTWKSSLRNLFRYKKRLFMTIFGIGGSMALLMVGFGLRDSIQEIVNNQYQTLWIYDAYLSLDEDGEDEAKRVLEEQLTKGRQEIEEALCIRLVAMDAENAPISGTKENINLFVPETLDNLEEFLVLKNRITKEPYRLEEGGAIISEKLARLLDLSVGDTLYLVESETQKHPVTITAIAENYLYHYVYMTKGTYEQVMGKPLVCNEMFLKLSPMSEEEKADLAEQLMKEELIQSLTYVEDLEEQVENMMNSLDLVVVVLILAAGLLAFVVLYNLNNISIMERRRELATIKVLGFYDIETAEYVYRENILLTFFGILMGVVLGIVLHQFVIRTCEIDMIMFGRAIKLPSYVYSVLLTIVFAMIVNFGMFFKLRKIDMVESLKSVE